MQHSIMLLNCRPACDDMIEEILCFLYLGNWHFLSIAFEAFQGQMIEMKEHLKELKLSVKLQLVKAFNDIEFTENLGCIS